MTKRPYTREETAYLIAAYPTTKARVIAAALGRTYASVLQRAKYLGLTRTAKQKSAIYSGWSRQPKHRQVNHGTSQTTDHGL